MASGLRFLLGRIPHGIAAACLLTALAAPTATASAAPGDRPNIVLVLTDDMEQQATATMPRLQALARRGATFEAAYAITPMCVPARATILTGKYPQNTGVRSNRAPSGGYAKFHQGGMEDQTAAVWLRNAGYRTGFVGKYINWYPEGALPLHIPRGWDRWVASATYPSMHNKYNYTLNEDGREVRYGETEADYSTDVYAAKARAFIAEAADAGSPFLLYLWLPSPHTPEVPAPRHAGLFADAKAPRGPSFPERDTSDKPSFLRFAPLGPAQVDEIDRRYRERLRMLASVDEALGSIEDLLEARGLLDDTYIVFSADHGWHQGQHNQMPMKGRPHEEDIRVPLVVAGPGVPAGRTIRRLIGHADLAPTFADWAGVTPDTVVDGRSFAGLLTADEPARFPWRRRLPILRSIEGVAVATRWATFLPEAASPEAYTCLEHLVPTATRAWYEWRGLRSETLTYVEHVNGDRELYYAPVGDPFQIHNAYCRADPAWRNQLAIQTAALTTCRGESCRRAEDW